MACAICARRATKLRIVSTASAKEHNMRCTEYRAQRTRNREMRRRGTLARCRHRIGPRLDALECRIVLAVDNWIGPLQTGSWSDPLNWSLGEVPGPNDIAYFSEPEYNPADPLVYGPCVLNTPVTVGALYMDSSYNQDLTVASPLTIDGSQGDSQWSGGGLSISSGASLTNQGTFNIGAGQPGSELLLSGGGSLINAGTIAVAGTSGSSEYTFFYVYGPSTTIENEVGATFEVQQGSDVTGPAGAIFTNLGTISDTPGTGQATFESITLNNSGTIEAQAGMFLVGATGGGSAGGVFSASAGATLELLTNESFTFTGTFTGSGAGVVDESGGSGIIAIGPGGASFDFPSGLFSWNCEIDVTQGNLTNDGSMEVTSAESGGAVLSGPGYVYNDGTIGWTGSAEVAIINTATLLNEADGLIDVPANNSDLETFSGGSITNAGELRVSSGTGEATINHLGNGVFNTSGTIDVETGQLNVESGTANIDGGTFDVAAGAVLAISGGDAISDTLTGSLTGSGGGAVQLGDIAIGSGGATLDFPEGMLEWWGTFDTAAGNLTNDGTIMLALSGGMDLAGTGSLINNGAIIQTNSILLLDTGSTLINTSSGLFDIQSAAAEIIPGESGPSGTFDNLGLVRKSAGTSENAPAIISSTLDNSGQVEVDSGALTISGSVVQISNGTLTGGSWKVGADSILSFEDMLVGSITTNAAILIADGTGATLDGLSQLATNAVGGTLEILNGGSFTTAGNFDNRGTVDLEPGSLNVAGTYTQESSGSLDVGIGGDLAGSLFGQIEVKSQAALAGTLSVSVLGHFAPTIGDSFRVLTFGSRNGDFGTEPGLDIGGGEYLSPSDDGGLSPW